LIYATIDQQVVFAFIAAIIAAGTGGSAVAYGLGVSICMMAFYFFFFAVLYWLASIFSGKPKSQVELTVEPPQDSEV